MPADAGGRFQWSIRDSCYDIEFSPDMRRRRHFGGRMNYRAFRGGGREGKENPAGRPGFQLAIKTIRIAILTIRKTSGGEINAAGVVHYWPVLAPFFAPFLACFVCFLDWVVVWCFLLCFFAAKAGIDRVVAMAIAAINVKNFFMGSRTSGKK